MRYICKANEPEKFAKWKALANSDWQPTYNDLSGEIKAEVFCSLLKEQGNICCYCERELVDGDYHIEHLNPQSAHVGDDLNYANFLCSCLNKTARGDPLHCGKLKGSDYIEVHPLLVNCSSEFSFVASGEITGRTEPAQRTIATLGLDINKLTSMRKTALEPFLDDAIEGDDFLKFVQNYLTPSEMGHLNPFQSMITEIFTPNAK